MKQLFLCLIFLVFSGVIFGLQRYHDTVAPPRVPIEDFKYLPNKALLKCAALSFDEIVADYLWIQALGYFGGHYQTDKQFPWLAQLIDTVNSLDPVFIDPYEFGGVVFGYVFNDVERSNAFFAKGMADVPKQNKRYWLLPFFTAFNYMYFKGDYETAAKYLEQAAQFPQRPAYLPLLVARLYANTEDPTLAIPFLEKMIEQAATQEMRTQLERRIGEIQVKDHLRQMNQAREQFRQARGREPNSLDELVAAGFLSRIPQEPFGGRYFISTEKQEIMSSSEVDSLQMQGAMKPTPKAEVKVPLPFSQPPPQAIPLKSGAQQ